MTTQPETKTPGQIWEDAWVGYEHRSTPPNDMEGLLLWNKRRGEQACEAVWQAAIAASLANDSTRKALEDALKLSELILAKLYQNGEVPLDEVAECRDRIRAALAASTGEKK